MFLCRQPLKCHSPSYQSCDERWLVSSQLKMTRSAGLTSALLLWRCFLHGIIFVPRSESHDRELRELCLQVHKLYFVQKWSSCKECVEAKRNLFLDSNMSVCSYLSNNHFHKVLPICLISYLNSSWIFKFKLCFYIINGCRNYFYVKVVACCNKSTENYHPSSIV